VLFSFGLSSLPRQPQSQSDKNRAGEPALKLRDAFIPAQQLTQRSTGVSHTQVYQRSADIENQSEQQNLQDDAATARVNELWQKRQKKYCDLGIEHVGNGALAENGAEALRLELSSGEIALLRQHLDTEIYEIARSGVTHQVECQRRRA
jgi:hypothetical protein